METLPPPPPLCYFLLFLEAVLNMYEGWDWQVGFNWFWSTLHEQQPAPCPFCGVCVLLFFLSPLLSLSSVSPSSLLWSVQTTLTTLSSSLPPPVSASSDFSSVQVEDPRVAGGGHTRDIRVSSKLNLEWRVWSICPCTAYRTGSHCLVHAGINILTLSLLLCVSP